ncbi:hypothetical protein TREMEDRAFT_29670 [Tremella mesenterica DSM 1558]|uniref:uncharacterized protein n=1 Tax=Tremella mesenterica (strain ATCC 24925 / CBS 8224 / DSM 1558 / NBRC 9311 / NRRL Y-6157 / RJB 2259-6 / UBC 559-6) TaxID=578456 RepID=UPI0003F490FB|nr:uncharacterized protein TREMEDRAFT_29670 [Tremella mesenterica DSM 1558]EIW69985.1 hypothetical protein TREMEDRAFT_29670 [Tremella mesenterica DSM 1558]
MTSISPLSSLATFTSPHASSSKRPQPHVTLSPVVGAADKAVAVVQGDGIWTYDLSTLRPITSFTVSPSTIFSTRALSYMPMSKGKEKQKDGDPQMHQLDRRRIILVGVQTGENVAKDVEGNTLWAWRGEDGSEHQKITLSHSTHSLHHLAAPVCSVLVVGSKGEMTLLDDSFNTYSVVEGTYKRPSQHILAARVLSCTSRSAKVVLVDSNGHFVHMQVIYENLDIITTSVNNEGRLPLGDVSILDCADISGEGVITGISKSSVPSLPVNNKSYPTLIHPPSPATILSIPPLSGRPLILLPSATPQPKLLLVTPSLTLPAVVKDADLSTFFTSGSITSLSVISQVSGNIFVVGMVVLHHDSEGTEGRSVLYTCELTLPAHGVGINTLLGSQARTKLYIRSTIKTQQDLNGQEASLIQTLKHALSHGNVADAENLWKEWIDKEDEKAGKISGKVNLREVFVKKLLHVLFEAALPDSIESAGEMNAEAKTNRYAGEIIKSLISRKGVNDDMWEGGLVMGALVPLKDWDNIRRAVKYFPSLSPSVLVSLLQLCTSQTSRAPPVKNLLFDILSLPAPSPQYKTELRRGLNVDEAAVILQHLVQWAELHVEHISESFEWDLDSSKPPSLQSPPGIPSLDSIAIHSSVLLDAHLPSLSSHEPSQELLERLQGALQPLLELQEDLIKLRAPVEALLTLARREEKWARAREQKRMGKREGQTRVQGVLSEMVGKWRVEDFVF